MFATDTLPVAGPLPGASWFETLETMQPGPELAAALDNVDRDSLTGDELVSVMIAHRRLAARYMGLSCQDIAAIGDVLSDTGDEYHHTVDYTAAATKATGPTNATPTATTNGPHPSTAPTPQTANPPLGSGW